MAYEPDRVKACRMVMLEVLGLLEPWRDSLVLIGGWAVQIGLDQHSDPRDVRDYVGTMDVDFAGNIGMAHTRTIRGRLLEAGYLQDDRMPERMIRIVQVGGEGYHVPVDLLMGVSVEKRARQQRATSVDLTGELPDGTAARVTARVASVADLLAMKMGPYADDNAKVKDGYDVYQLMRHAADSPEELAAEAAAILPPEVCSELARNIDVFFLKTKRAARDAAIMVRDFHGTPKADTVRDARNLAQRFLEALGE